MEGNAVSADVDISQSSPVLRRISQIPLPDGTDMDEITLPLRLPGDEIVLGRQLDQVGQRLDSENLPGMISRRHVRFRLVERDFLELEDLGSVNGVYVNNTKLTKQGTRRIFDGDRIVFGVLKRANELVYRVCWDRASSQFRRASISTTAAVPAPDSLLRSESTASEAESTMPPSMHAHLTLGSGGSFRQSSRLEKLTESNKKRPRFSEDAKREESSLARDAVNSKNDNKDHSEQDEPSRKRPKTAQKRPLPVYKIEVCMNRTSCSSCNEPVPLFAVHICCVCGETKKRHHLKCAWQRAFPQCTDVDAASLLPGVETLTDSTRARFLAEAELLVARPDNC